MKTEKQTICGCQADRLAAIIAKKIIHVRSVIAGQLDRHFNSCSPLKQKWLVVLFSILAGTGLLFQAFTGKRPISTKKDADHYQATHIGQASGLPQPSLKATKPLTLKKEHYGK